MVRRFKRCVILLLLMSCRIAFASGDSLDFSIHRGYESIRALGMGNAFTAVADDYSGLFLNPAALARREDGELNLSLDLAISKAYVDFAEEVQTASDTVGTDRQKQEAMVNLIQKNYGNYYHIRTAPASAIWVRPNWGIGFIPADVTINMSLHNQLGPAVDVTAYADSTLALGFARDYNNWFNNGRFSLGVTGKLIHRGYASQAISAFDLVSDNGSTTSSLSGDNVIREGLTLDADIGSLWTPDLPAEGFWSLLRLAKPSFSFVARNVFDYGFTDLNVFSSVKNEQPQKLGRRFDIGTRWEYPAVWIFGGRGTLDLRDMGHENWSLRKGIHAGFEFDWRVFSWWKGQYRVGVNQGYLTLGASALFTIFSLDVVTYGEEVGTYNINKESRRYAVRMNMNF